ncbi:MAG: HhH-GPD family protein [Candidatus Uhrbacteria bacterium GW2011_GWF2_41_16]|uniref:HhH-GPD family protein n=2 Tax=Candidatus Uhriibacteriota TaxID=1752732 RepID=A0A0G0XN70_9BACT|nr:MAG: HhH-GPD family protein [Candidatus Uhrbacteria bacterium GW2011_GWC2_41_11]KKR98250.1 MAG: HhH-GPD family protein [Candidatus Uhrbacteria bacterium GW2011_GWF2_41_16]HBO99835.1 hypothetical protein [Candidatus Uhrbacteria bacterium]
MITVQKLLSWYDRHGRDLPWRKTRNPYHILVSEIMLQQTQVSRVLIFYSSWLKQFPDWKHLAQATNTEIIHAWSGLGYNKRGLMLRDIAREIVKKGTPQTRETWMTLKGIGPYTASALTAFSLHERVMPIDTNIRRVLGRFFFGLLFPDPKKDKQIQKKIKAWLPTHGRFYDVPQALFDLASSVCTKIPNCVSCPLRKECHAAQKFLSGNVRVPKNMIQKAKETHYRNKPYPDRIYRGRMLKCVRLHDPNGVDMKEIGLHIDPSFDRHLDTEWLKNMLERMIKNGLLKKKNNVITLG